MKKLHNSTKKSLVLLLVALGLCLNVRVHAQGRKTVAVLGMYISEIDITPEMASNLYRIEMNKIDMYQVLDKLDLMEVEKQADIDFISCYGRNCLEKAGKLAQVDLAVTGSIESLGKKMVVSLKVYDVKSGAYDKTYSMEFMKNTIEIQRMIRIVIRSAYDLPNKQEEVEMLVYYEEPPESPRSQIKNNGPRFGISYIGGETGAALQRPEYQGGYDVFPVVSQFGYQFEKAYISAGNFQALVEGLVQLSGVEQNLFIPSLTFLNGFRSSKNGIEFGFGPSLNIKKIATGAVDEHGNFILERELLEYDPIMIHRVDSRGDTKLSASWVWAVGKTFRSGYLNMPVNAFFSHGKYGWYTGLSMGFNVQR